MHELALQDKTTQDRDKTISVLRDKKAAYKNQVFATHTAPVGVDALRGNTDNIHRRARTHARARAHTHTRMRTQVQDMTRQTMQAIQKLEAEWQRRLEAAVAEAEKEQGPLLARQLELEVVSRYCMQ